MEKLTGYLLTADVASMFGVELRTVYRWIKGGKLHPQQIGRTYLFDPEEVEEFKRAWENNPRIQARKGGK